MDTPQDTSAAGSAGASRGAGPGRPTIKDVAAAAGVSTATVSRVLSGTSPVSPDLVARVTRVIDELGYSPNGLTRGVFKGRSNSIGVLVGDLRNHFYVELVRGPRRWPRRPTARSCSPTPPGIPPPSAACSASWTSSGSAASSPPPATTTTT